ncbi:MaoC/PaaZ C-terminal domain-containing protein [Nocardia sp. NPDC049190]|uniref:MaoC/PaaZ C-terminal domain-containing protein n=1 Tax=Nocardia sp. NPDC049190 TaxID=3155650 RepID=UPI0033C83283
MSVPEQDFHWADSDVHRYHRAVGWNHELDIALPTFAMTAPGMFGVASPEFYRPEPPEVRFPGVRLNLATLLHREQDIVVHRRIPVAGRASSRSEIVEVEDLGTAAVLVQHTTLADPDGHPLITGVSRIHARGEGGCGGPPGAATAPTPDRRPDTCSDLPTTPQQALRYQRCGRGNSMRNNVHTDPAFAEAAGFPMPILQGACTYAMVCATVLETLAQADPGRVRRYSARFLGVVFPGETLRTRMWADDSACRFVTSVLERAEKPVLSGTLTIG